MSQSDHFTQSYKNRFGQFTLVPLHGRSVKKERRRVSQKGQILLFDLLLQEKIGTETVISELRNRV
jgi:hypothetical protein